MAQIAILGSGTGGLPVAYELADSARAEDRITVISDAAALRAGPPVPWLSAQCATRRTIEFPVAPGLTRKGIAFSAAGVKRLHPGRNQVGLGDGSNLDYDVLVIAAGPRPAFEEIEGLGPNGHTQSLCHTDHLPGCVRAWRRLLANPGPIVVGAAQGASCFAPAYESALRMDADLRRRGLRSRAPITFITAEPFIGHLGVGGTADSRVTLEAELRARGIEWITGARILRVERGRMRVTHAEPDGKLAAPRLLAFKYALVMPPFRGIDALSGIDGLVNERGFVIVDEFHRNPKYRNIYAAGVAVERAAAQPPSGTIESRKAACMPDAVAATVAKNILDQLEGKAPSRAVSWHPIRLADLGGLGLAFIADQEMVSNAGPVSEGEWVHMTRCSCCDVAA